MTTKVSDASRDEGMQGGAHATEVREVLRLAAMTNVVLGELRHDGLDDAQRSKVEALYRASLNEADGALSDDLRGELQRLVQPLVDGDDLTAPALRIAEAQLSGWLDGLIQGLQANAVAQRAAQLQAHPDTSAGVP